jgi:hypothetical protein
MNEEPHPLCDLTPGELMIAGGITRYEAQKIVEYLLRIRPYPDRRSAPAAEPRRRLAR